MFAGTGPRTQQLRDASAGTITFPQGNRIKRTVLPQSLVQHQQENGQEKEIQQSDTFVADLPRGSYEARVCWPASEPASFDILYDSHAGLIHVTYSADFYSQNEQINKSPLPVNYEIIVEKLVWFGSVPKTVADIIKSVAAAAVVGYYLTNWILGGWFVLPDNNQNTNAN